MKGLIAVLWKDSAQSLASEDRMLMLRELFLINQSINNFFRCKLLLKQDFELECEIDFEEKINFLQSLINYKFLRFIIEQ